MAHAYRFLTGLGLVAIVSAAVLLIAALLLPHERAELLWVTWGMYLLVVLCMESRVRMGYRLSRGTLFAAHLASAIPGLLLLTAVLFFPLPSWCYLLATLLLLIGTVSGAILFHQGWKLHSSKP